jgi:hypothetical protein
MKFLKVKEGTAIAINSIKAIKSGKGISSKIYTNNEVYEVEIPFETLMNIIERDDNATLQQMLNIMKTQGTPNP